MSAIASLKTTGLFASAMADPRVYAGIISVAWSDIQPTDPNSYNWAIFDNQITQVPPGKGFWLDVYPGVFSPPWLYNVGAQGFSSVIYTDFGGLKLGGSSIGGSTAAFPPFGQVRSIPVPWDLTYRFYWKALIAAMGKRYFGHPQLVGLHITPFSSISNEMFLPNFVAATPLGKGAVSFNDNQNWANIGYSQFLIDQAFNDVNAQYVASFPGVPMSIQLVASGFPADPLQLTAFGLKSLGAVETHMNIQGYANVPTYETQNSGMTLTQHVGGVQSYQGVGVFGNTLLTVISTHFGLLAVGYPGAHQYIPKRIELTDVDIANSKNSAALDFIANSAPSNNLPKGISNPSDGTLIL